jgi:hypothetical protein
MTNSPLLPTTSSHANVYDGKVVLTVNVLSATPDGDTRIEAMRLDIDNYAFELARAILNALARQKMVEGIV